MKTLTLFLFGAFSYGLIELIWRGFTHWSMLLAGGLCFLIVHWLNRSLSGKVHYLTLCVLGAAAVTVVELIFGAVFNLWLGMRVWDYSAIPLNLWGQICLPFSLMWVALMFVALNLERQVRFRMFGDV